MAPKSQIMCSSPFLLSLKSTVTVPALENCNECHSEDCSRWTISYLKSETSLGVLLAAQRPDIELVSLGNLLRQEICNLLAFKCINNLKHSPNSVKSFLPYGDRQYPYLWGKSSKVVHQLFSSASSPILSDSFALQATMSFSTSL